MDVLGADIGKGARPIGRGLCIAGFVESLKPDGLDTDIWNLSLPALLLEHWVVSVNSWAWHRGKIRWPFWCWVLMVAGGVFAEDVLDYCLICHAASSCFWFLCWLLVSNYTCHLPSRLKESSQQREYPVNSVTSVVRFACEHLHVAFFYVYYCEAMLLYVLRHPKELLTERETLRETLCPLLGEGLFAICECNFFILLWYLAILFYLVDSFAPKGAPWHRKKPLVNPVPVCGWGRFLLFAVVFFSIYLTSRGYLLTLRKQQSANPTFSNPFSRAKLFHFW